MAATPGTQKVVNVDDTGNMRIATLVTDASSGLSNAVLGASGLSIPVNDIPGTAPVTTPPVYAFEFLSTFTSNATAEARFGLSAPTGWTASWGKVIDLGQPSAGTVVTALAITDPLVVEGAATTVLTQVCFKGTLIADATHIGNFGITFAQGTSNGTDATVLKAFKTYLQLTKIV